MKLSEIIVRAAESMLPTQSRNGEFPHGHNGPYYDEELPLRNTSHIMMLLLKAHDITGEAKYRDAALRALSYITADDRRPMGATFWARRNPEKDFSNGLIGQAWVMEALAGASQQLGDTAPEALAEKVFLLHPFDEATGRWRIVNVDGSYAGVDTTFNHQLWFAAAGGMLQANPRIDSQVRLFLDKLEHNLKLYDTGLIVHPLGGGEPVKRPLKRVVRQFIKTRVLSRSTKPYKDPVINKAIGYHAFNTYAFALLFQRYGDHAFWRSDTCARMLRFLLADLYREGLEWFCPDQSGKGKNLPFNRFGYPYNPPGIEVAYTIQTFKELYPWLAPEAIGLWLERQFSKTLQAETGLLNVDTDDGVTLSARLYEAVRLEECSFSL